MSRRASLRPTSTAKPAVSYLDLERVPPPSLSSFFFILVAFLFVPLFYFFSIFLGILYIASNRYPLSPQIHHTPAPESVAHVIYPSTALLSSKVSSPYSRHERSLSIAQSLLCFLDNYRRRPVLRVEKVLNFFRADSSLLHPPLHRRKMGS